MPLTMLWRESGSVLLADRHITGHPWRMQRPWRQRCATAALLTLALIIGAGCRPASGALAGALDRPGQIVRLADGRGLNFQCSGRGAPTVLLEAGFGADSRAWAKVQPTVSRTTRVCSYDRAGYGFSDPGPLPRDGAAIARDLDQALAQADIRGPFIVVGHSAGGLYARLFAARRQADIAGLVFLDPTIEQIAPADIPDADGLGGIRQRLGRCLAMSLEPLTPDSRDPITSDCKLRASAIAPATAADLWRNQLSELDNIFRRTSSETARIGGMLADVPVYVITASDTAAAAPRVGLEQPQSTWELRHQQLARQFQTSSQQTVLSSHLVMVDRPDVAIAAIFEMVRATQERRTPAPLPPSEWSPRPLVGDVDDGFQSPRPAAEPFTK